MKKNKLLICLFGAFIGISCNKSNVVDHPNDNLSLESIIQNYQALNTTKLDASFCIKSLTINGQENTNTTQIGGAFYDEQGNVKSGGGINIGGVELLPKNNFYGFDNFLERNSFYGKNVTFKINNLAKDSTASASIVPINGGGDTTVATIYVPLAMQATMTPYQPFLTSPNHVATTITWNADPANTNGVVIVAEYAPGLYDNTPIATNFPGAKRKSVLVSDNGSAALSNTWFNDFPRNSTVVMYIGRGNYTLVNQNQSNVLVGAYTGNAVFAFKMPSTIPAVPGPGHG